MPETILSFARIFSAISLWLLETFAPHFLPNSRYLGPFLVSIFGCLKNLICPSVPDLFEHPNTTHKIIKISELLPEVNFQYKFAPVLLRSCTTVPIKVVQHYNFNSWISIILTILHWHVMSKIPALYW